MNLEGSRQVFSWTPQLRELDKALPTAVTSDESPVFHMCTSPVSQGTCLWFRGMFGDARGCIGTHRNTAISSSCIQILALNTLVAVVVVVVVVLILDQLIKLLLYCAYWVNFLTFQLWRCTMSSRGHLASESSWSTLRLSTLLSEPFVACKDVVLLRCRWGGHWKSTPVLSILFGLRLLNWLTSCSRVWSH